MASRWPKLNRLLNGLARMIDGQFFAPSNLEATSKAPLQVFAIAPPRDAKDILSELHHPIDPLFLPRRMVPVDCLQRDATGKPTEAAIKALRRDRSDL